MKAGPLEVKVVVKVRGMWKLTILNFLMRHKSARHVVHVHLTDNSQNRTVCVTHAERYRCRKCGIMQTNPVGFAYGRSAPWEHCGEKMEAIDAPPSLTGQ